MTLASTSVTSLDEDALLAETSRGFQVAIVKRAYTDGTAAAWPESDRTSWQELTPPNASALDFVVRQVNRTAKETGRVRFASDRAISIEPAANLMASDSVFDTRPMPRLVRPGFRHRTRRRSEALPRKLRAAGKRPVASGFPH